MKRSCTVAAERHSSTNTALFFYYVKKKKRRRMWKPSLDTAAGVIRSDGRGEPSSPREGVGRRRPQRGMRLSVP